MNGISNLPINQPSSKDNLDFNTSSPINNSEMNSFNAIINNLLFEKEKKNPPENPESQPKVY